MYFKYVIVLLLINFLTAYTAYPIEKCYEIGGSREKLFPVSFVYDITLFPKYISIDFSVNITKDDKIIVHPLHFYAQLVDKQCSDSPLVFPNLMGDNDEKSSLMVKMYYGGSEGLIDQVEAFVLKGYDSLVVTLEGLEGRVFLKIKFSADTKRFPSYEPFSLPYFIKLPVLKYTGAYCLKLFKSGSLIILRMIGNELLTNKAYDHYFIKITIMNPETSPQTILLYFAETYVCDEKTSMTPTKLYTDQSTSMIKFEAYDNHERQLLKAIYQRKEDHFERIPQLSNINLEYLDIISKKANNDTDAILLYQTKYSKIMCDQIDEMSYIELYKSEDTITKLKSYIRDSSENDHKIVKIKRATQTEIDKCLQK